MTSEDQFPDAAMLPLESCDAARFFAPRGDLSDHMDQFQTQQYGDHTIQPNIPMTDHQVTFTVSSPRPYGPSMGSFAAVQPATQPMTLPAWQQQPYMSQPAFPLAGAKFDPSIAFNVPSPVVCGDSGSYVPITWHVQLSKPYKPLPMAKQVQLQLHAYLQDDQLSELSVSDTLLNMIRPPEIPPTSKIPPQYVQPAEFDLLADGKNDVPNGYEAVVPQPNVSVLPPNQCHSLNSDLAQLTQKTDCFEGPQRQFMTDLMGTISRVADGIGESGAKEHSEKIIGTSHFNRHSLTLSTYPYFFIFPGNDKMNPVYVDVATAMSEYSESSMNTRTSISSFIKHIMHVTYQNPSASYSVTAGCNRSTKGLQVMHESTIQVLSTFWMNHFYSTPPQNDRVVFEVMTQIIKNYLDKKRSEIGRKEKVLE